jgi:hypothetical protein
MAGARRLHKNVIRPPLPQPQIPAGVMARVLTSHTGPGGWLERGLKVSLSHPNIAAQPDCFELCGPIPAEWRGGKHGG